MPISFFFTIKVALVFIQLDWPFATVCFMHLYIHDALSLRLYVLLFLQSSSLCYASVRFVKKTGLKSRFALFFCLEAGFTEKTCQTDQLTHRLSIIWRGQDVAEYTTLVHLSHTCTYTFVQRGIFQPACKSPLWSLLPWSIKGNLLRFSVPVERDAGQA